MLNLREIHNPTTIDEKFERRLTEELSKLRVEFLGKLADTETKIIRWMFIFWVGQLAVMTGLFFTVLRR